MFKSLAPTRVIPLIAVATVIVAGVLLARNADVARWHGGNLEHSAPQTDVVRGGMTSLPLAFEANQGQTDSQVRYIARARNYTLYLTNQDAVFALRPTAPPAARRFRGTQGTAERQATIRMQLEGGNQHASIAAASELPGKTNYFIGRDRSRWHAGVRQYASVSYKEIYPGVDLSFHGKQRQPEFDFIIAPQANAGAITLQFSGADQISPSPSGELTLASGAGDVILHRPVAYQEVHGARRPVEARFVLDPGSRVHFALGAYDHSRELTIDPSVTYATYLGGAGEDDGYAIALDGSGNVYVTGQTNSTDFPTTTGVHSTSNQGSFDAFVTKLSADGSTLLYSTYVGGTSSDSGNGIAVNSSGSVYVAGGTASSDFPVTSGVVQSTFKAGGLDAFVFELSATGGTLVYSTYLGGTGLDVANGLAIDSTGDSYVVGYTESGDFPTHNPIQSGLVGVSNGFVAKLNSSGNAFVYSTFLGGGSNDFASAVAADSSGNAFVTGGTQNAAFPTTTGAFQTTCGTAANCNGGLLDAFVSVIKSDGSGFVYSTFLGGGSADQGLGIAVDSAGSAYVTGQTQSNTDFPTKSPIQSFGGGTLDAFVTKLNPAGNALVYSTYLGGNADDSATSIAVDSGGNAYVTGRTASTTFPTTSPTQATLNGTNDAFITEINATGSARVFSTFLGGSAGENTATAGVGALGAVAVPANGSAFYVTGNTISTDFPVHNAVQTTNGGNIDAFVAKFTQQNFTVAATALNPASVGPGESATSTVSLTALSGFSSSVALTCSVAPSGTYSPTCSFSPASITPGTTSTLTVATTASTPIGSYTITITGTSGGLIHTATLTLPVATPDFTIAGTALNPATVNAGAAATSTITVGSLNDFSGSVALTCAVAPASGNAPTCALNPTSVAPGTPSTLTVSTTTSTAAATYTITVTGTSGSLTHSAPLTLTVTVPDFGIGGTPLNPASVTPGSSATSTVSIQALNGFTGSVALTCAVTPTTPNLPTCSFSPASITSSTHSTLTVATTASATGTYTVTVTGTSGSIVHSTPLSLTVNGPNFTIAGSALSAVTQGSSITSTITIAAVNSYTGTVNFTCAVASVSGGNPLPTCSIPGAVMNGAGTSTLTVATTGASHALNASPKIFYALWLPIAGLSLAGMRFTTTGSRRKKLFGILLLGTIVAALFFLPACGGSNSTGGGGCTGCTPKGTYNVTVTGTDSANAAVTHSVSPALTLTVN